MSTKEHGAGTALLQDAPNKLAGAITRNLRLTEPEVKL
jgi:hypothetical protein